MRPILKPLARPGAPIPPERGLARLLALLGFLPHPGTVLLTGADATPVAHLDIIGYPGVVGAIVDALQQD